jgi:hypothetical protein
MASALAWWVSQVAACLQLEEFEEKEIVQDQQARIAAEELAGTRGMTRVLAAQ